MLFSSLIAAAGLTIAGAQTVKVLHVVNVGMNGTLTFSPNNFAANVGEQVQFHFFPKNHSVVQSNFANPCIPLAQSVPGTVSSFFSGFMPTTDTDGRLTFTIDVTDTKPIWFYCSQANHCQQGMVGAINAPGSGNTIEAFAQKASVAKQNITPGQSPSPSSPTSSSSSSSSSSTPSSTTDVTPASSSGAASSIVGSPQNGVVGLLIALAGSLFVL